MYFNDRKENTNIDNEFKKKKKIPLSKIKNILIISGIVLFIFIIILIIIIKVKNRVEYYLELNGDSEISIFQGTNFNDPGCTAYDNKNNNHNSEVNKISNLDTKTIGEYTITYTFHDKSLKRIVKVLEKPAVRTVIQLNGEQNIYLKVGDTFKDPGYESAIDMIDGDITNKVVTKGSVDTSKAGTYRIEYSVTNSSNETTTEIRTVIVE